MLYFLWCNFDYDNFGILDLNLIFEHNKSVQDIQSHTLHALLLMFYYSLALNQGMCLCCDGVAKHDPITLQGVCILPTFLQIPILGIRLTVLKFCRVGKTPGQI